MIPDFAEVEFDDPQEQPATPAVGTEQWREAWRGATGKEVGDLLWETPEGIAVQPLYTGEDLTELDFLDT